MVRKVCIIGGGVSGFFLGASLAKQGDSVTIYERDASIDCRRQGYSLTMRPQSLRLLEEIGLEFPIECNAAHDTLYKWYINGITGDTMHRTSYHSRVHVPSREFESKERTVVVPREELRRKLLDKALEYGVKVNWDVKIEKDNLLQLIDDHDIVFACDGAHSRCRKYLLPNESTTDSHLINVYGLTPVKTMIDYEPKLKSCHAQVLDGIYRLFTKPFNEEFLMWELTWPEDETKHVDIHNYSPEEAIKDSRDITKSKWPKVEWASVMTNATNVDDVTIHALHSLDPSTVNWRDTKVIFVGDAAHPMVPYLGLGANEAIFGAALLAKEGIEPYLKWLEDKNGSAALSVRKSYNRLEFCHSSDTIDMEKLKEHHKWN